MKPLAKEIIELQNNDNKVNSTGPVLDIPQPAINNPLSNITYDDIKDKGLFDDLTNNTKEVEEPKQPEPKQENKLYENNTDDDAFFDDFFNDD